MSIFRSAPRTQFLLLFLLLPLFSHRSTDASDCSGAKQEWVRLRYTSLFSNLPSSVNTGPLKEVCPVSGGPRCCDQNMEREMYALGRRQLLHQPNWLQLAEQMNNDSNALEYFFRSDLEQAKNRLHQFFSRIYGYNYKLHRSFFFRFFTDLEEYMAGRRGRLASLVDNFFSQLRDNIVSLIERSGQLTSANPAAAAAFSQGGRAAGTTFNLAAPGGTGSSVPDEAAETRRIRCLSDRVAQLRPFDEVDVRLKARLLEAYPPARMLVNVMSTTSRLLSHLAVQVNDRPECILGLTRFRFCALCAGQPLASVCPDSCPHLLAACLHVNGPDSAQLTAIWPRLIEAIVMATSRLERSFNFPAVNRNLQMEISEAITSLQARYEQTKSKFEAECRLGSTGRAVPTLFSSGGTAAGGNHPMSPNANSISRPQQSSADLNPSSSFSGWPPMDGGFRWKPNTRRARSPQMPSMASPEFLDWQVRPRSTGSIGAHQTQTGRSDTYGASADLDYRQPAQPDPNSAWASNSNDGAADVPERLMRWAGQLKRTYTNLGNWFAVPGANFCPATAPNRSNNRTGAAASVQPPNCWTPPPLTDSAPHHGIAETLRQLAEAAERLHQASVNSGDPDALVAHLSPVVNPAFGSFPSQMALNNPYADQQPSPHGPAPLQQWRPPVQPTAAAAHEAPEDQEFAGSGTGPLPDGQLPSIEHQPPPDFYERTSPTPTSPLNYNQPPAVPPRGPDPEDGQGSGRGYYEPGSYYESAPVPERPDSGGDLEQHRGEKPEDDAEDEDIEPPPSVKTSPQFHVANTTAIVHSSTQLVPRSTTKLLLSTTTTTTTETTTPQMTEPTSTTTTTTTITTTPPPTTTTARPQTQPTPAPPPVVVPPGNRWLSPETGSAKPSQPSINQYGPNRYRFESSSPPHQGAPLPDDEDSLSQPGFHEDPLQQPQSAREQPAPSQSANQPWHGAPAQAPSQQTWWEEESQQSGGSGYGGEAGHYQQQPYQPAGVNNPNQNYNWAPGREGIPEPPPQSPPVDAGTPPYDYLGGSGVKPPGIADQQTSMGVPGAPKPDPGFPYQETQNGGEFGQPVPEWGRPQAPEDPNNVVGQGSGNWPAEAHPGGITQWQDNAQSSGTADTAGYLPEIDETIHNQRPPEPLPQPPVPLPPPKKPEQTYPHPPMPPPEVWVPAQLGPGQPISSVLLVREYNVQGPFYGPETSHAKPSSAVANNAPIKLPLIVVVLRMLHPLFI